MSTSLNYQSPYPRLAHTGLVGREGKTYFADPNLLAAANAALVTQQPLLLTGEAGCGKTDFAFAAASGLAADKAAGPDTAELLECYVRSDSRARDLLYHYDAIRRFGDAQHGGEAGRQRAEDPRPYIRLRPLGKALMSPHLRVVLIDEIDKAPRDLPNDLLRELDQGVFEIPEIPASEEEPASAVDLADPSTFRNQMRRPLARVALAGAGSRSAAQPEELKPLVIITSNVERQLPDPFLRRCVFFHIRFPSTEDLQKILHSRFDDATEPFIERAIEVFEVLRAVPALTKKPATSELINWVQSLRTLHEPGAVRQVLDAFAGGGKARDRKWSDLPWKTLPAMGCLVKLQEDLARLHGGL